jgi:hypothetical protein
VRAEREPRGDEGQREERPARHSIGEVRPRRPRRERAEPGDGNGAAPDGERISLDVLPPAIAPAPEGAEVVAKAPRRRARRPREEGEADIAPAA